MFKDYSGDVEPVRRTSASEFLLFNCTASDHHNGDLQTKSQSPFEQMWYLVHTIKNEPKLSWGRLLASRYYLILQRVLYQVNLWHIDSI